MKGVILYRCGQNINRAYRLCYTHGIEDLYLVDCPEPHVGQVFSAAGNVRVSAMHSEDIPDRTLGLEKGRSHAIEEVPVDTFDYLLIGGENVTVPKRLARFWAHIPTTNTLCLTVDQSLAVALEHARLRVE